MSAKKIEPSGSSSVVHTVERWSVSRGASARWVLVGHSSLWRPPTDMYETETAYVIEVEVAGMRGADLAVSIHARRVTVSGLRPASGRARAYHQMEIHNGEFRTEVILPGPFDREAMEATYNDGFLKLVLPKPAPRPIGLT